MLLSGTLRKLLHLASVSPQASPLLYTPNSNHYPLRHFLSVQCLVCFPDPECLLLTQSMSLHGWWVCLRAFGQTRGSAFATLPADANPGAYPNSWSS